MRLKPVYYHRSGAHLYQAGARYLNSQTLSEKARFLAENDVAMILDVATQGEASELALYADYHHVPFGDNKQFRPHMGAVVSVAKKAATVLAEGRSVMTCCQYGINRSGLTNALIIRESERCSGAEAFRRLKMHRKGACGGNPHFAAWLIELPCP